MDAEMAFKSIALREAFVQHKESALQGLLERSLCARSLRSIKKTRVH
jgi:hypothetical protein